MRAHHRTTVYTPSLIWAAYHEADHAVATVLAFVAAEADATSLINYVEITPDEPGESGNCVSTDIYSARWDVACIAEPFRPLMEAQITIEIAGGIAEAVHRGERRKSEVLRFAEANCCIDADLERAGAVLGDLRRLTGVRYDPQDFAERTLALMLAHRPSVSALASALVEDGRIGGERVERIIERRLVGRCGSWARAEQRSGWLPWRHCSPWAMMAL